MSAALNKVILIGNLGRDPELRETKSGNKVTNFSVATTERWKDPSSGEQRENTEWHRIVVWGKQAEIAAKFLKKGRQVYIEGSIAYREWEDGEGNKRLSTDIKCQRFLMLGSKPKEDNYRPSDDPDDDNTPF